MLATPAIRALAHAFPHAEIHMLINAYLKPGIADYDRLDRLWVWDKKAMRGSSLFAFARELRAQRFDVAIVLSGRVPSFTSFLWARAIGARRLWAYDTRPFYGGATWSRWLASWVVPAPAEHMPEARKFAALVEPLTGPIQDMTPEFSIPAKVYDRVREARAKDLLPEKHNVVINLGGNPERPERLWPLAHWITLVKALASHATIRVIALVPPAALRSGSGAEEVGIYAELCAGVGHAVPKFQAFDLVEVAAFLQGADLFITPDGGLLHIAAAARVPTLGLFFLTDPALWYYQVPWALAVRSAAADPATLTPAEVLHAVKAHLLLES